MNGGCTHLDRIYDVTPSSWGCEDCLAQGRRDWVHLRGGWRRSGSRTAAVTDLIKQAASVVAAQQTRYSVSECGRGGAFRRVDYARLSSSTGMVRTPAVWRAYSAKPG